MVGGGTKKDDGLPAISSTNIFSALESRRKKSNKKKSTEKEKASSKIRDSKADTKDEGRPQIWEPSPVTVKSWADCDEDDDYYATTAPPANAWAPNQSSEAASAAKDTLSQGEETEGEDEAEEEAEDEPEEEQELESSQAVSVDPLHFRLAIPLVPVTREPEKQLSKKELKKKELAELDAVLAELGLAQKEENGLLPILVEKKADEGLEFSEEMEGRAGILSESKSSKRRKAKKEKSFKDSKDGEAPLSSESEALRIVDDGIVEETEGNPPGDPKEVLKKLASLKKKKSMKESDAAAKAAASEAAARATKLAAAKKKEKNHYNQQPVR